MLLSVGWPQLHGENEFSKWLHGLWPGKSPIVLRCCRILSKKTKKQRWKSTSGANFIYNRIDNVANLGIFLWILKLTFVFILLAFYTVFSLFDDKTACNSLKAHALSFPKLQLLWSLTHTITIFSPLKISYKIRRFWRILKYSWFSHHIHSDFVHEFASCYYLSKTMLRMS